MHSKLVVINLKFCPLNYTQELQGGYKWYVYWQSKKNSAPEHVKKTGKCVLVIYKCGWSKRKWLFLITSSHRTWRGWQDSKEYANIWSRSSKIIIKIWTIANGRDGAVHYLRETTRSLMVVMHGCIMNRQEVRMWLLRECYMMHIWQQRGGRS